MGKSSLPALPGQPRVRHYKKYKQCIYIKPDGNRCQAYAGPDSKYCFFHDPKKAEARAISCSKGGRSRKVTIILPLETPDFVIQSTRDVVTLLEETINQVRRGQLDQRIAQIIGNLAGTIIRAQAEMRESGELEEQKKKLEEAARVEFQKQIWGDKELREAIAYRLREKEDHEYKAMLQGFGDRQERLVKILEEKARESKDPDAFLDEAVRLLARLGMSVRRKAKNEAEKPEKGQKSAEPVD